MRKIKSFKLFESKVSIESIEQEAKDNLAYLLDGGEFTVDVELISSVLSVEIKLKDRWKYNTNLVRRPNTIQWQSIKDDIIPYLELVSSKYDLGSGRVFYFKSSSIHKINSPGILYNLNELEDIDDKLYSISFTIRKWK